MDESAGFKTGIFCSFSDFPQGSSFTALTFTGDAVHPGVTVGIDGQRLPREVETVLYRIVQEALTNAARHTSANQVSVLLQRRRDAVVLVIEDDGEGFDVADVMASPQRRERLGLYGMEERASLVDGHLTVESAPGTGTTITVEIPLEGVWLAAHGVKRPADDNPSAS